MNKPPWIILLCVLPVVRLQTVNHCYVSTVCDTEIKATKTIADFWHRATTDSCELNIVNLYEMRKKLEIDVENYNYNLFNELLSAHISTYLMKLLFRQIMDKISTKSSIDAQPNNFNQIINDLYREDKKFILKIWQQALDASAVFMDMHSIIQHILLIEENNELKLNLLNYLLLKYEDQHLNDQRLMPFLVYAITNVGKEISNGDPDLKPYETLKKILNKRKIPKLLKTIYLSTFYFNVSLLNRHYNKAIFSDPDNGAADDKRLIFTFMPQLAYNVKGVFKVEVNAEGMVAFGTFYKPSYRYIVAEDHSAFICLSCAASRNQWWQVLWSLENQEFVAFQNTETGELLCATDQYKANWVLISMLAAEKNLNNPVCHWKVYASIKGQLRDF